MIGFVEYLISKGYKPYRKVMSKKGSTYVEDSNIGFYSSMSEHIDLRLIKGKKEVVLREDILLLLYILDLNGLNLMQIWIDYS